MCGIVGLLLAAEEGHANQELFDSLTALQHRGQGELALLTPREESAGYGGWFSPMGRQCTAAVCDEVAARVCTAV